MTTGELIGRIYDLPERKLFGLAVQIKQHPERCKREFEDFGAVKDAFERVLDIRGPERKAVRAYYYKGNQYPEVMTMRDLRTAYFLLKIVVEGSENVSTALMISLKCSIRAYTNRPTGGVWIVKDDGIDGYTELREMPRFDSMEEADDWFKRCYYMEAAPSAYDCTGQHFTVWYKLFRRRGRWWAYHRVGVDV